MVKRGEVYWANLDPTIGTEIRKTRPVLVVSPNDMNAALPRVIIAPITSKGQALGCRPSYTLKGKPSHILLDQIRSIDQIHLLDKIEDIPLEVWHPILLEMLA